MQDSVDYEGYRKRQKYNCCHIIFQGGRSQSIYGSLLWGFAGESQGTHAIPFSELPKRIRFVGRKNKTLRFRAHRHRTTIEPTGIHKSTVHIGMGSYQQVGLPPLHHDLPRHLLVVVFPTLLLPIHID